MVPGFTESVGRVRMNLAIESNAGAVVASILQSLESLDQRFQDILAIARHQVVEVAEDSCRENETETSIRQAKTRERGKTQGFLSTPGISYHTFCACSSSFRVEAKLNF